MPRSVEVYSPPASVAPTGIAAGDTGSVDAFGRWRTSEAVTLFDSQQTYGDSALVWENALTGTGAVANLLNESTVTLSTGGAASGAKVVRSTRAYHRYQPGKSELVLITFVAFAAKTDVRFRAGLFDAANGIFLEQTATGPRVVRRTYVTGSPVDNAVAQADWNLDTLTGNGGIANPSGITLDLTKTQILIIDLQWLGVGRVRIGFDIDGLVYYVHEFMHANTLTAVYMTSACLPVRFEIENTGAGSGSTTTAKHICSAVVSEAGFEAERGLQFSANSTATPLAVTTRRAVLSIRAKSTGPNSVANRGQIIPRAVSLMVATNPCLFEIVLNGALGGVPAWSAVNASYSLAESDVAGTTVTGGVVVDSGYVAAAASSRAVGATDLLQRLTMVMSALSNTQDVLSVVCTATTGTTNVNASITWQELY